MLIVLGAVAYIVNPVDLVPDWLPRLDKADDVAVLLLAIHALRQEFDDYRKWKEQGSGRKPEQLTGRGQSAAA